MYAASAFAIEHVAVTVSRQHGSAGARRRRTHGSVRWRGLRIPSAVVERKYLFAGADIALDADRARSFPALRTTRPANVLGLGEKLACPGAQRVGVPSRKSRTVLSERPARTAQEVGFNPREAMNFRSAARRLAGANISANVALTALLCRPHGYALLHVDSRIIMRLSSAAMDKVVDQSIAHIRAFARAQAGARARSPPPPGSAMDFAPFRCQGSGPARETLRRLEAIIPKDFKVSDSTKRRAA